ncbi:hypothetical protein H0H87_000419 [Tephrocybe sp. NHM501043]|nr:hypothetical protein H0H87_000419 [Tephrocybe sp. NHM501043]
MTVKNGGKLTYTKEDFYKAKHFFCNGLDDPWLHSPSRTYAAIPRKRTFNAGTRTMVDNSYKNLGDPRAKKRQRIHWDEVEGDFGESKKTSKTRATIDCVVSKLKSAPDAPDQITRNCLRTEERQRQLKASCLEDISASINDATATTLFEDTSAPNLEDPDFLMSMKPTTVDLRTLDACKLKNTSGSNLLLTKFKLKADAALAPKYKLTQSSNSTVYETLTLPQSSASGETTLTLAEEALSLSHAAFWRRTREAYNGSGPLILKIDDIVHARVNAKIFKRGESCYGEVFDCYYRSK